MSKSVIVYAGLLVLSLGAAWNRYTGEEPVEKEGVQLLDVNADDLEKVVYTSPDLTVTFELKTDDFGRYGWATVEERKKGKEGEPPPEPKVTKFKTGSAADKVVEAFAPMFALRELAATTDEATLTSFGLKEPDSSVAVTHRGKTVTFDLGGETYGTKDRYARNQGDGKLYVLDDEPFKTLKFAATRLPERQLLAGKVEAISGASLGVGGATASWSQKNRDDRAAAFWEREGAGKDETFGNWMGKALKLKSTGYVQEGETPTDLVPAFDLTIRADGEKPETVRLQSSGEDWYAQSESTRGLVKLSRSAAKDVAEDAKDVVEGRTPPGEEKPADASTEASAADGGAGAPPVPAPPTPGQLPRPNLPKPQ